MAERSNLTPEQRDLVARMTGCEPGDAHLFADNIQGSPDLNKDGLAMVMLHVYGPGNFTVQTAAVPDDEAEAVLRPYGLRPEDQVAVVRGRIYVKGIPAPFEEYGIFQRKDNTSIWDRGSILETAGTFAIKRCMEFATASGYAGLYLKGLWYKVLVKTNGAQQAATPPPEPYQPLAAERTEAEAAKALATAQQPEGSGTPPDVSVDVAEGPTAGAAPAGGAHRDPPEIDLGKVGEFLSYEEAAALVGMLQSERFVGVPSLVQTFLEQCHVCRSEDEAQRLYRRVSGTYEARAQKEGGDNGATGSGE